MFGIVFLMFICMSLLFVAKRIRFFAVMAVLFAGLTLMLYSGTLYQIIMANYDARNILDKYNIVQKINAFFKSGITDLRFISLIGETAILFSYVLTGIFLLERKRWLYGLLLIPVIFYFVISLPQVSYSFYLVMNSHRSNDLIYIIYEVCLWTKRFSAAGCFIFPVAVCIIRYYNTILWIAKRQLIILVSCIGTISLVLLFFINYIICIKSILILTIFTKGVFYMNDMEMELKNTSEALANTFEQEAIADYETNHKEQFEGKDFTSLSNR